MIDVQPLTVRDWAWAVQVEAESWGSLPLLRARESSLTRPGCPALLRSWRDSGRDSSHMRSAVTSVRS
jgi:hypothetical protein